MKVLRRWLIYRRLVNELTDLPARSLDELGTLRTAIRDFAWHAASLEVEPGSRHPDARHTAHPTNYDDGFW
jgi:hypothetical protein